MNWLNRFNGQGRPQKHSPILINAIAIAGIVGLLAWGMLDQIGEVMMAQQALLAQDMHESGRAAIADSFEEFTALLQSLANLVLGGFIGVVGTLATQRMSGRKNGDGNGHEKPPPKPLPDEYEVTLTPTDEAPKAKPTPNGDK